MKEPKTTHHLWAGQEFNLESDEHGERDSEADTESLPGDGASAVSVDDTHVPLTEPDAEGCQGDQCRNPCRI